MHGLSILTTFQLFQTRQNRRSIRSEWVVENMRSSTRLCGISWCLSAITPTLWRTSKIMRTNSTATSFLSITAEPQTLARLISKLYRRYPWISIRLSSGSHHRAICSHQTRPMVHATSELPKYNHLSTSLATFSWETLQSLLTTKTTPSLLESISTRQLALRSSSMKPIGCGSSSARLGPF